MEKQPRQFGIFALFVLTTAVAAALAIIRLPIERYWKVLLVGLIGSCFGYWRNRKYRDQQREIHSPADRRYLMGATLMLLILIVVSRTWGYELRSDPFADAVFFGVLVLGWLVGQWLIIKWIWKSNRIQSPPGPT